MTKKAKAPGGATPRAGQGGNQTGQGTDSIGNLITRGPNGQASVADFLHRGEANATTRKELQNVLHLPGRTIRLMIERERRRGVPILSGQKGYWLAADAGEIRRFYHGMMVRAGEIQRSAACVLMALSDFEGSVVERRG